MTTMAEMERKIDSLQTQVNELLKRLEAFEAKPRWEIHHHEHHAAPAVDPGIFTTPIHTPYIWETICGEQR